MLFLKKNRTAWQYLFTKTTEKAQSSNFSVEAEVLQRWMSWWKLSNSGTNTWDIASDRRETF